MKIVHFSDPHAGGPAEDLMAYFDKRWVGVFNYRFRRRFRFNLHNLELAVSYILDTRPDAAVCTGDLTSTGQPGEFEKIRAILRPLRDAGIPLYYTPGNHDCYVRRAKCVAAVHEMVEYLSLGQWSFCDFPQVRRCGPVDFLMVNTSFPSNLLCSWGRMTRTNRDWLREQCAAEKERPRILLNHYPLFEENSFLRLRHRLLGARPVQEMVEDGRIDLALCGHIHRPYNRLDETGRGESCAGSVSSNGAMNEIEYDEGTDIFHFRRIQLEN